MSIYVEIRIDGPMDELWRLTQTPDQHERWDLRFTDIEYLPRPNASQPQQFLYATRIGFGLAVQGKGETVGARNDENGERTSALKFWSDDPKSLIREGAGYWRYVPTNHGIRFLTSYDYRVRFGLPGRLLAAWVFRPLLGWATAWSFDRLRLWIEQGIDPATSLRNWLIHAISRITLAFVWIYHGAVPKLIVGHADEIHMVVHSGFSSESAVRIVQCVGAVEIAVGLAVLIFYQRRWPLVVTIAVMFAALLSVGFTAPQYLVAAFNPVSLNLLMMAFAVVGLLAMPSLPSARRCLRRSPETSA